MEPIAADYIIPIVILICMVLAGLVSGGFWLAERWLDIRDVWQRSWQRAADEAERRRAERRPTHPRGPLIVVNAPPVGAQSPAHPGPWPAPRTDGAPRAHAENDGAPGARTAPAPQIGGALTPDLRTAIAQIAGHKLTRPEDMKSATARALGITRSGTSERYAVFSAAWDILYPPPADPAPTEYVTDRDRRLLRELVEDVS